MEPVKYLKDMLGVVEGSIVDTSADIIMSAVPQVGQLYQTYQIKQLQKRMKLNEQQLSVLKNKIESSENEVFYKQEVFPLIVKKLMDEDEDVKSKVIIDGFEYIIDNDLNEIERIYHYYDVLSELRYSDIMVFVQRYMPFEMRKKLKLNINLVMVETMDKSEQNNYQEKKAIEVYQDNKLRRLGLIIEKISEIDGGTFNDEKNEYNSIFKTEISDFGIRFLKFFSIEEPDEN